MQVLGIGTDIIEVSRIRRILELHPKRFPDRVFTEKEQLYCLGYKDYADRHFAGRFAAKEAIIKAFGTGFRLGIGWLDIEVINDKHGKPQAILSNKFQVYFLKPQILLSISHCHEYATAVALLVEKK